MRVCTGRADDAPQAEPERAETVELRPPDPAAVQPAP
jgi:hypothetical protein